MKVLMTGGGTAGHINPALAIARKIQKEQPNAEILFVGATGRMETVLVPQAGYPIRTLTVEGFSRSLSFKGLKHNVTAAWHAVSAEHKAKKILDEFKPDVAIGTGGYVCGPVLRQAQKQGIPVLLHESNALPGVTVKMLAKHASAVMVPTEAAKARLPEGTNAIVTGNPLREGFEAPDKELSRKQFGVDDRPLILCFGGSLGARPINEAIAEVLKENQKEQKLQFIVATGRGKNYNATKENLAALGVTPDGVHVQVREYIDDMPRCMAAADLVICRCGAMTLSELPAMGKPSILIPSPYVAENHQFYNAKALTDRGAALCIEEKDLTGARLWDTIKETALSPDTLGRMGEAAKAAAVTDAADRIYRVICDTVT